MILKAKQRDKQAIGVPEVLSAIPEGEFAFMQELAHAGKIAQGRFIARRQ